MPRHPKPTRAQIECAPTRIRSAAGDRPFDPRAVLEQVARDSSAPPVARVNAAIALLKLADDDVEDTLIRR